MPDTLRESYEAAPYESNSIPTTQIGSMEAVAMLHGMSPTPANRCRVLELGCASGGNLIPMAYRFPDSHFLGVDLADGQVAKGTAQIARLGLRNIELRAMSLADIDDTFGTFDYVIAHGVYSWVPDAVQDALLRVSSRNLAPNGVAYISYNIYPGWHLRELMRNLLIIHDDPSRRPAERVMRARSFADRLATRDGDPQSVYELVLADEAHTIQMQNDSHVLHEQLEPFNQPVYFAEFARRAGTHGLRYVCESKPAASGWQSEARVAELIGDDASDPIRMQQYIDIVRGRAFRRSLLCHDSVSASREPTTDAIKELMFVTYAASVPTSVEDAAAAPNVESFQVPGNAVITTNTPLVVAVMRTLIRAKPRPLSLAEIADVVAQRLGANELPGVPVTAARQEQLDLLPTALLQCTRTGLVDVDRHTPQIAVRPSLKPRASAVVRDLATDSGNVTTLLQQRVSIGPTERFIVSLLDGSRARADLLSLLQDAVTRGLVSLGDRGSAPEIVARALDDILNFFGSAGLLEA